MYFTKYMSKQGFFLLRWKQNVRTFTLFLQSTDKLRCLKQLQTHLEYIKVTQDMF